MQEKGKLIAPVAIHWHDPKRRLQISNHENQRIKEIFSGTASIRLHAACTGGGKHPKLIDQLTYSFA